MARSSVYLDSSALVKLVLVEPETRVLGDYLSDRARLMTSVLAQVELRRAARRVGAHSQVGPRIEELLDGLALISVSEALLDRASTVEPVTLRSLDAIHLATALSVRDEISELVTYDQRMAAAAQRLGLAATGPA